MPPSLRRFAFAILVLFSFGCDSQKTVNLLSHLVAAEKQSDTEVILFGSPKASSYLTLWSEAKRHVLDEVAIENLRALGYVDWRNSP